jgi:hypothetical protein
MHKYLVYGAYGWLTFGGTMHFIIDVVSQKLRGVRTPSPETTLYYGLNSSYALGQVLLGALGLWLFNRSPELIRETPMLAISFIAGIAWLTIGLLFIEYREPKIVVGIYLALLLGAAVTGRMS